jgi:hypothetical protein
MADDEHPKSQKLRNFLSELHNSEKLTDAEKRRILYASMQSYVVKAMSDAREQTSDKRDVERREMDALELSLKQQQQPHSELDNQFFFAKSDLEIYVIYRKEALAAKSIDWIIRASQAFWDCTRGELSETSLHRLRTYVLNKYASIDSHRKVLAFARAFLKHLATKRGNQRIQSLDIYLELPKTVRTRKTMTERIVRREDIVEVFERIDVAKAKGKITREKARNYRTFALLASYAGLRPSTMQRLTVGQFRAALQDEKPSLHVFAEQEKNRVEHSVPLSPIVVGAIEDVLAHDYKETDNAKPFFLFNSFEKWLERQKVPLPLIRDPKKAHLWLSDFRKFAEQFGDVIGWDTSNRKYILAHGMTGVDWTHYKHFLPEDVYDKYMQCWRDVDVTLR